MTNFTLILILCFFGHIFCTRHESAFNSVKLRGRKSFEIRVIDENSEEPVDGVLPLIMKHERHPTFGNIWSLTCGYNSTFAKTTRIHKIEWKTWKLDKKGRPIKEDNAMQRFPVHTYNNNHVYKQVLTIKKFNKSDDKRIFYCEVQINGVEGNKRIQQVKLELMDTSDPDPPLEIHSTTNPLSRTAQKVKIIENKLKRTVRDVLPLFAQNKTQLMLGETAQFICGFKLSEEINLDDIGDVQWGYTIKPNVQSMRIKSKNLKQKLSVKALKNRDGYRKVLTIKNLTEQDIGGQLFCEADIKRNGRKKRERIHELTLELSDKSDLDSVQPVGECMTVTTRECDKFKQDPLKFEICSTNPNPPNFENSDTCYAEPATIDCRSEHEYRELLRSKTFATNPNRQATGAIPLLRQYKPILKVGDTMQLTCGYSLSNIDRKAIKSIKWYTYKSNQDKEPWEILKNLVSERISVKDVTTEHEYKHVLTVKNVDKSDIGRQFYCFALTEIKCSEVWQYLNYKLDTTKSRRSPVGCTTTTTERPVSQSQEFLEIESNEKGVHPVPLIPQYKPTLKLGETIRIACVYELSKFNYQCIESMNWYTHQNDPDMTKYLVSTNTNERIYTEVNFENNRCNRILTVKNLTKSDKTKNFYCRVRTNIKGREITQSQVLQLNIPDAVEKCNNECYKKEVPCRNIRGLCRRPRR